MDETKIKRLFASCLDFTNAHGEGQSINVKCLLAEDYFVDQSVDWDLTPFEFNEVRLEIQKAFQIS